MTEENITAAHALRCVAIDDEPIALEIIEEYCRKSGGIELHTFTSPVEGMEFIHAERPDVVFMDIEMSTYNGMELARTLPEGVLLVFTTAYAQFALDGFNIDAVDFLHKPIFYSRFSRAIDKIRRRIVPSVTAAAQTPRRETITLKVEHKNVVIDLEEILYVEAMENYVKVHRRSQPKILSQITMKEMETLLPSDRFMRVHRSYIVGIGAIEKFSNRKVFLKGVEQPIPVGRKYVEAFNGLNRRLGAPGDI